MNIYIYGSKNFKEEIHSLLKNSDIKLKLKQNSSIKDLKLLDELKNEIKNNPDDIYLIDEDKIFRKNIFNKNIKFLKAKDCIEEEYLLDYGIGDISVNNKEDLIEHIIKKIDDSFVDTSIEESIINIVDQAYKEKTQEDIQLDDKNNKLLNKKGYEEDNNLDKIITSKNNDIQGDDMTDEFSQFDNLKEEDVLNALENIDINDTNELALDNKAINTNKNVFINQDSNASNVNDISQLITQLLNNKTLEITIKVKN